MAVWTASDRLLVDDAVVAASSPGFLGRRRDAARARLLAEVAVLLSSSLDAGERVRWLARGCRRVAAASSSPAWVAAPLERAAIVVTDRRLVLIELDGRGRPAARREQVALDRIRGTRAAPFRPWRVDLADGTALRFVQVSGEDRRRLGALLFARPGPRTERDLTQLGDARRSRRVA